MPSTTDEYWHLSIDDWETLTAQGNGEEGGPDEPLKVKTYPDGERIPLPHPTAPTPATHPPDPYRLGSLLWLSYGLSRLVVGPNARWPYRRTVASARCFYPTELYLCVGGHDAGVYHYDPGHHCLVRLRAGDHTGHVAAALTHRPRDGAVLAFVTSMFWKSAFRYRDYAYRLCAEEAGMVTGNVAAVGAALGFRPHVSYRFDDGALRRLLGLAEGEESVQAVVELAAPDAPEAPYTPEAPDETPVPSPAGLPIRHVTWPRPPEPGARLLDVDRRSRSERGGPRVRPTDLTPPATPRARPESLPATAAPTVPALASALALRNSGGDLFVPDGRTIPLAALASALSTVPDAPPRDCVEPGLGPLVDCYLIVSRVDGLPAGGYRLDRTAAELAPLPPLTEPAPAVLHALAGVPSINAAAANAVVYLAVPYPALRSRLGEQAMRIANHEAGAVAQRICLGAAAAGLSARISNTYRADAVADAVGLTGSGWTPVMQIVLASRRSGSDPGQYCLPVVW